MDSLDFEIALELSRQPFASYRELGRRVKLSGNSVMGRLDRMRRVGIFEGFYVLPVAAIFHRHWQVLNFVLKASEPDLSELLEVEDVVMIWRGRPRTIMVNVYTEKHNEGPPSRLERLIGGHPAEILFPDPPSGNPSMERVSLLNWRIMDALLDNPVASVAQLAEITELGARTARKHRDILVSRGLVRVLPGFNTSLESGMILFSGQIVCKTAADLDSIHVRGMFVMHQLFNPPAIWVFGHAPTYAHLQEIETQLKENPKVVRAELMPSRGGAFARERLHGWIRKEIVLRQNEF
jgi:DNA-binding Lrp family transcriptional regulator